MRVNHLAGPVVLSVVLLLTGIVQSSTRTVSTSSERLDALVKNVLASRTTAGFRATATLTRTVPGTSFSDVRQISVWGRRAVNTGTLVYQQVWPAQRGPLTVALKDAGDHHLRGVEYGIDRSRTITPRSAGDPLFESDLILDDLFEDFWFWPSRAVAGEEYIGQDFCVIADFRADPGASTPYSRVRAWISSDRSLALRLQKFGRDGTLDKTINMYRVLGVDGHRWPGLLTVEPARRHSRTVVEGAGFEEDPTLQLRDLSRAALEKPSRRTP